MSWLSAPRAPPPLPTRPASDAELKSSVELDIDYPVLLSGDGNSTVAPEDENAAAATPPFSLEVAAVEVADAEDPDAAHVEVSPFICAQCLCV